MPSLIEQRISALERDRSVLKDALEELHDAAKSYVDLSRFRGEDIREEAAHRVRNAIAAARAALKEADE